VRRAGATLAAVWGAALLGFALGGYFDAGVLHPLLDPRHQPAPPMLGALLDLLHASALPMSVLGAGLLLAAAGRLPRPAGTLLAGAALMGFGLFHLATGLVDHLAAGSPLPGDVALLIWGVAMLFGGEGLFAQAEGAASVLPAPPIGRTRAR
jgi:uncharacterized membrane protein